MTLEDQLKSARAKVNTEEFGTIAWENAMEIVRDICAKIDADRAPEEFCSVDSGIHRTRLTSGKII